MTYYLPYIFGLTSFFIGLYWFLRSFGFWKPKYRTEEQKERYEKIFAKYGTIIKVLSVILILKGAYNLIMPNPDSYRIGNSKANAEWSADDKALFIKHCMRDAGATAKNYPQITKEYCDCSADKVMKAMTKDQYVKSLSKPMEDQVKEVLPIFQDCVNELRQRIDSVKRQRK